MWLHIRLPQAGRKLTHAELQVGGKVDRYCRGLLRYGAQTRLAPSVIEGWIHTCINVGWMDK